MSRLPKGEFEQDLKKIHGDDWLNVLKEHKRKNRQMDRELNRQLKEMKEKMENGQKKKTNKNKSRSR